MSRGKIQTKSTRESRNRAQQAAMREKRKLRKKRAAIHGAMTEAARRQRSKKKGTRDFEQNMQTLGFTARSQGFDKGRALIGTDVLQKYAMIEEASR